MSSYSEDLRSRVVSAVEAGMSKAQAARTFSVNLSSVKRYVNKAKHGESLAPKKRPGSTPKHDEKARRLLTADLEKRLYLTLRQHCDYIEAMTGLSVSCSTMCRAIARIGSTRKKGTSRYRARRVRAGGLEGDGVRGGGAREAAIRGRVREAYLPVAPICGYAPKGERLYLSVIRRAGARTLRRCFLA